MSAKTAQYTRRPLAAPLRPAVRRFLPSALVALMSLMIACDAMAQSDATGGAAARVEVSLDGEIYSVRASAQLAADQRVVWETLTDYERLREFIPGVTRARVLARTGNQLSIEQVGVFSVLFIDLPVRVRLAVQHLPYTMVLARMDASPLDAGEPTLRSFSGRYTLSVVRLAQRAGVRLDYDAQFELTRPLPVVIGPLFGVAAVRGTMRAQFEAMLREIERRQALLVAAEQAE
ncbi:MULTISPECIES: SRPBCC family protein [Candidatus Accumulibacter]|uniref:SRPBCC family protein n=2 Tax=Betaproteobacteria incertae sedis TaxID=119066 RepID=A0A7D5S690_9PROT|nr:MULTISPECIES: SRPBCC family protein [Candidatus Accumulibacter]QLH48636.1 MAG: SRPBCC family protein [Candidatus Accumulibacter cognatus]MBL8399670.1 SRPBCC family protein [Accumulibacter sp.]MCC2868017.1 SRPBCC family protein [Candidatus Accumulibacter phosphatis]MCM8578727.1 SRPBCC family protein [Accumulibacter sp.]HMW56058.1 SRPBCC family protein [Accumulibacter sp.]